jgi:hypothetical protein
MLVECSRLITISGLAGGVVVVIGSFTGRKKRFLRGFVGTLGLVSNG